MERRANSKEISDYEGEKKRLEKILGVTIYLEIDGELVSTYVKQIWFTGNLQLKEMIVELPSGKELKVNLIDDYIILRNIHGNFEFVKR